MDVFALRNQLIRDYATYIESFVNIRDDRIRAYVDHELDEGLLWRPEGDEGPLRATNDELTLSRFWVPDSGKSLESGRPSVGEPSFPLPCRTQDAAPSILPALANRCIIQEVYRKLEGASRLQPPRPSILPHNRGRPACSPERDADAPARVRRGHRRPGRPGEEGVTDVPLVSGLSRRARIPAHSRAPAMGPGGAGSHRGLPVPLHRHRAAGSIPQS